MTKIDLKDFLTVTYSSLDCTVIDNIVTGDCTDREMIDKTVLYYMLLNNDNTEQTRLLCNDISNDIYYVHLYNNYCNTIKNTLLDRKMLVKACVNNQKRVICELNNPSQLKYNFEDIDYACDNSLILKSLLIVNTIHDVCKCLDTLNNIYQNFTYVEKSFKNIIKYVE